MVAFLSMIEGSPTVIGRYAIFDRIAAGGMASVHVGRLLGEAGFSRTVAIKRLHPQLALDPDFVAMFLDEARICARIRHPNVVPTLDVFAKDGELFLVMEYVEGQSVAQMMTVSRAKEQPPPVSIVASIVSGMLHGLHAAHDAKSDAGEPLGIVHRDVSPQNVLVATDGIARVLDFGVAKALGRLHTTRDGAVKGKVAYMAPEQIEGGEVTRSTDVFAAAAVLWEALTTRRLFHAENEARRMHMILHEPVRPPSEIRPDITPELDAVVMRGLQRTSSDRYASALEMAEALERAVPLATPRSVGVWVRSLSGEELTGRAARVAEIERLSPSSAALRSLEPEGRREVLGPDERTVVDPASRTQASSISVSRSGFQGEDDGGTKRGAARTALLAGAALLAAGLIVRLLLPSANTPRDREAASAASAPATSLEPTSNSTNPTTAEPGLVPAPVSAYTPDASTMSQDPALHPPTKHPPRPKKAIYSRE
jgi:serine/threonine protein kinase